MAFFIYTLIIGVVGYGLQMNAYESIGITFFVVMEVIGIIVHIMRNPNPKVIKSEMNNVNIRVIEENEEIDTPNKLREREMLEYKWIKQLAKGLGCMIFAVFLFLNSVLLDEPIVGIGISWIIMLFGIFIVMFPGDEKRNIGKKVGVYRKWR